MGCCDSKIKPNLPSKGSSKVEFIVLEDGTLSPEEELYTPPAKRHCTDVAALIVHICFVFATICLVSYAAYYSDVRRFINGYDSCGNICGVKNTPDPLISCKGVDQTERPYLLVKGSGGSPANEHRECVSVCPNGFNPFTRRCVTPPQVNGFSQIHFISQSQDEDEPGSNMSLNNGESASDDNNMQNDFTNMGNYLIGTVAMAVVMSVVLLVLFHQYVEIIVYLSFISILVVCLLCAIIGWAMYGSYGPTPYAMRQPEERTGYLYMAVFFTVLFLFYGLIFFLLRHKLRLVAVLYRESHKVLKRMLPLFFLSLLTLIWLAAVLAVGVVLFLVIMSAGHLVEFENQNYYYQQDGAMGFAKVLLVVTTLWMLMFIYNCEHYLFSGAVSKWFFTMNKDRVKDPIKGSFCNLVRFHLGTVSLASLILTLVQLILFIIRRIEERVRQGNNICCMILCCLFRSYIEFLARILEFVCHGSFVMSSMYGTSFYPSIRRLFDVGMMQMVDTYVMSELTAVVKACAVMAVAFLNFIIAAFIFKQLGAELWIVMAIVSAAISLILCNVILRVYNCIIDVLLICFKEDLYLHDGIDRPYYMSRELSEFLESSKSIFPSRYAVKQKEEAPPPQAPGQVVTQELGMYGVRK